MIDNNIKVRMRRSVVQDDGKGSATKSDVDLRSLPVVKAPCRSDSDDSSDDADAERLADIRRKRSKIVNESTAGEWHMHGQICSSLSCLSAGDSTCLESTCLESATFF